MDDEDLDDGGIEEAAALPRERAPRPEIEERLVAELRRRGWLRSAPPRRARRIAAGAAAAAAAVILLGAGFLWGARPGSRARPQAHWVLLLREGSEDRAVSAEESRRRVQEYAAWARGASGLVGGEKLGSSALLLRGATAEEAPAARTPQSLAGFFLLGAVDAGEARALAATCPHLRYGGEIELRPIEVVP